MRLSLSAPLAALGLASGLVSGAGAATVYDESVSGDLSNAGASPTFISTAAGSNQIFGTTGKTGGVIDLDYFTVALQAGQTLTAITLLPGSNVNGSLSFIGVQAGSKVTVSPTGGSATGLLGWTHYSTSEIGTDILPAIGAGAGATGFTPPLGTGTYSFWVQDTSPGAAHYGFDFTVTSVPEPTGMALMLAGLAGLGVALRRRAR